MQTPCDCMGALGPRLVRARSRLIFPAICVPHTVVYHLLVCGARSLIIDVYVIIGLLTLPLARPCHTILARQLPPCPMC